ncbi:response regulator [Mesorhizobium sp. C416B]|uniref:response regulator n=1 Tax=unclassified Mesorhizobium TaxID=325217 RepID=UPI0003CEE051|nr:MULTISPECIES: response regulator [unclassified Mesorhizobium]ESX49339.1 response regulator receiver [Mesorhizobium sp. LSHC426A00]ESX55899.1 response regulator receiver [Mesorhizobium sp. LSHC424B00]ESX72747.1 response regulator receiver [Mesorhizobium sp. LSHC416B00]WJI62243.1 response regulator [Mesorhizobium sp. C416B]
MSESVSVLIVEDQWLVAQDTAARLRRAGYQVVGPVPSVSAALRLVESDKIDVALLDIQLNGETGLPVARILQARGIPFAFLSGFGPADVPAAFRGCRFLPKPATDAVILAAVSELASLRTASR